MTSGDPPKLLTVYPVDGGTPFRFSPAGVARLTLEDPPITAEERESLFAGVPYRVPPCGDGSRWSSRLIFEWSPPGGVAWCGVRLLVGVDRGRPDPTDPRGHGSPGPLPGLHGRFLTAAEADAFADRDGGCFGGEPDQNALTEPAGWMFADALPVLVAGDEPGWNWVDGPPPPPEPARLSAGEVERLLESWAGESSSAKRIAGEPSPTTARPPRLEGPAPDSDGPPGGYTDPHTAPQWRAILGKARGGPGAAPMGETWWRDALKPGGVLRGHVHPDDLRRREAARSAKNLTYRLGTDCPLLPRAAAGGPGGDG